jgi:hypothetical protein
MRGPEPTGIVAIFDSSDGAASAIDWLRVDGLERRSISIIGPRNIDAVRELTPEIDHGRKHLGEIAAYWGEWGAALGAAAGAGPTAVALAAGTVGIGPLAAALVPALALVATTAGIGARAAALVGAGNHDQTAREYERAIAEGSYLVVIHTDDPAALRAAQSELKRLGATQIDVHGLKAV